MERRRIDKFTLDFAFKGYESLEVIEKEVNEGDENGKIRQIKKQYKTI